MTLDKVVAIEFSSRLARDTFADEVKVSSLVGCLIK